MRFICGPHISKLFVYGSFCCSQNSADPGTNSAKEPAKKIHHRSAAGEDRIPHSIDSIPEPFTFVIQQYQNCDQGDHGYNNPCNRIGQEGCRKPPDRCDQRGHCGRCRSHRLTPHVKDPGPQPLDTAQCNTSGRLYEHEAFFYPIPGIHTVYPYRCQKIRQLFDLSDKPDNHTSCFGKDQPCCTYNCNRGACHS